MARARLSRQEQRLQTREQLLEAAAVVFSRQGFAAASVEEVAEEAGYSKGAVYSNFSSKEELFLALLDRHLTTALHSVTAQLTQIGKHALEAAPVRDHSFATHLAENQTWNVLTLEFMLYALRHPTTQQLLADRYRAARQELAARLQQLYQSEGEHPVSNTEYVSWALIALGTGLALQAYLDPDALPSDLYRVIVTQLLGMS